MILFCFIIGCVLFGCGVMGVNSLVAAAMTRDLYLNGYYMPVIETIRRTGSMTFLKIDVILIASGVLFVLLAIIMKGVKK